MSEQVAKFRDGAIVRHIRTAAEYRIIFTPERNFELVAA
jgi:hypothetical protein